MRKNTNKEHVNIIRIPVFMTKYTEDSRNLFEVSKSDMIESVCLKIREGNISKTNKIIVENSSKTYTQEIVRIETYNQNIGDVPTVLLKISAHKTNIDDGYIDVSEVSGDASKKILVTKNIKIGSDNHFVLMYPMVVKNSKRYKTFWHIFIYVDPYKESEDFIRVVKTVLKDVLGLKTANLKRKDFVEELQTYNIIGEMSATFNTIEMLNGPCDAVFGKYITKGKIQSRKELLLENLPFSDVESLIDDDTDITITRKVFNIPIGKKEIKISKTLKRDIKAGQNKYNLLIESLFNESVEITDEEMGKFLYDPIFIIEKITPVILNYIS